MGNKVSGSICLRTITILVGNLDSMSPGIRVNIYHTSKYY